MNETALRERARQQRNEQIREIGKDVFYMADEMTRHFNMTRAEALECIKTAAIIYGGGDIASALDRIE